MRAAEDQEAADKVVGNMMTNTATRTLEEAVEDGGKDRPTSSPDEEDVERSDSTMPRSDKEQRT